MEFNIFVILLLIILYYITHLSKRFKKETSDNIYLSLVFIIFTIIVASREMNVGNDTQMYLNLFENCATNKWGIAKSGGYFEIGYLIFNILISYISPNPRFFMIVMSIIFNYVIYSFIKKYSNNCLLSTISYVGLLFFYTSMTMMRQFLAITIFLYSFKYIKEKKFLKYFISVVIASQIHSSAWIGLLLYPIYNAKFTKKRMSFIILIGIIGTVFIGPLANFVYSLLGRTNYYTDRIGSESISNVIYTLIYLIMFIFTYFVTKNKEIKNRNFYLYSLLMAAVFNMLAINMNILARAAEYFNILSIIVLPNVINSIEIKKNRLFISTVFVIFLVCYSTTIIVYRPNWNSAFNYKSCLIPQKDYVCRK